MQPLLVAVVGDVHGAHWAMLRLLGGWERARGRKLDFVLQVGDFEPHRDEADLATMAAPAKYRKLGDFWHFHQGKAIFPWPVYFIGGNHEPYGYLDTMPKGGELVSNCHYLRRAGFRTIAGLKVAYLSGIFRPELFDLPRPSLASFSERSNKDFISYRIRDIEGLQDKGEADVLLLHEWPLMPFDGAVRPATESGADWIGLIVDSLRPRRIFCGHAHFRWSGSYPPRGQLPIPVECLGHVEGGRDAFVVYGVECDGNWNEIS